MFWIMLISTIIIYTITTCYICDRNIKKLQVLLQEEQKLLRELEIKKTQNKQLRVRIRELERERR